MDLLDIFDAIELGFSSRLALVTEADWQRPTPCTEWDVRALVGHVVSGTKGLIGLFDGAERDTTSLGDDLVAEWTRASSAVRASVAAAIEEGQVVHRRSGDISVDTFVTQRSAGQTVHTWDLARAIGASEEFPVPVLERAYEYYGPRRGGDATEHMQAAPQSIPDDLPLLHKVLLCAGRTP